MILTYSYVYSPHQADAHWQRQFDLKREHLAILLDDRFIMMNDTVKNKGYGTKSEILALEYAFNIMQMRTVYADAILKNTRSQHILKKAGFREIRRDPEFIYYICEKSSCKHPEGGL